MKQKELLNVIIKHLKALSSDEEYFGSEAYTYAATRIYTQSIANEYVKQSWYDNRLKATDEELMCDLIFVLGANYMYKHVEEIMHTNYK